MLNLCYTVFEYSFNRIDRGNGKVTEQQRIHIIDGYDLGVAERTGIYVIQEDALTLVETGPSPSVKHIREGLNELGYTTNDVKYIIVTHIHLDHAGGAGLLLQECPNAKVVVHARGARHMVDPTRLIAGAKAVYKDQFESLFDPIVPIPEDRLLIKGEGDTLEIGSHCRLEFWDTPGHANHHLSIYDPISHGVFTGDTVGIRYQQLVNDGISFYVPSTSPNQFNPTAMQDAISRMKALNLRKLYFGHYGATENVLDAFAQVEKWLPIFLKEAQEVHDKGEDYQVLSARLFSKAQAELRKKNVRDHHPVYELIRLDMEVSAMGLMEYTAKLNKAK